MVSGKKMKLFAVLKKTGQAAPNTSKEKLENNICISYSGWQVWMAKGAGNTWMKTPKCTKNKCKRKILQPQEMDANGKCRK